MKDEPMSRTGFDSRNDGLKLKFKKSLRLRSTHANVSNVAGLITLRELDEELGLGEILDTNLMDFREQTKKILHTTTGMTRQGVYGRSAGYSDLNDAETLAGDPVMREVIGGYAVENKGASTSQMARHEGETLIMDENLDGLYKSNRELVRRARNFVGDKRYVTVDMDSTPVPVYGNQESAEWNGHYGCKCYHPLLIFDQFGFVLGYKLRPGNVSSADGWEELLLPILDELIEEHAIVNFRADAAFAIPELLEALEMRGIAYTIRIKSNNRLKKKSPKYMLTCPAGLHRQDKIIKRTANLKYGARSWNKTRRVVKQKIWTPGELTPVEFYIVTNIQKKKASAAEVIKFYNMRGTSEQYIKEGKQATNWARLSCSLFAQNEARNHLNIMAYNLSNTLRNIHLPEMMTNWSLSTIQDKLFNVTATIGTHARRTYIDYADKLITYDLLDKIISKIHLLSELRSNFPSLNFMSQMSEIRRQRDPPIII